MERNKLVGIILIVVGLISVLINFIVIYPSINCAFAPWVFWLIAILCLVGGLLLFFNVRIFHVEDD